MGTKTNNTNNMFLSIDGIASHNTSSLVRQLDYYDELIKEHNIFGNFNFINLNDIDIWEKFANTRSSNDGKTRMPRVFYECNKFFEKAGMLINTYSSMKFKMEANNYCVDKHLSLIIRCILLSLQSFSKDQQKLLNKKEIGTHLNEIIQGIAKATNEDKIYTNKTYKNLINRTYCFLHNISLETINNHNLSVSYLNSYTIFYSFTLTKLFNKNLSPHYISLDINKGYINGTPQVVGFWNDRKLSIAWFTNKHMNGTIDGLNKQYKKYYYEKYLKKNENLQPIFRMLEENYDRIGMYDIKVDKHTFERIPGYTNEKKEEILSDLVTCWISDNCPFLKFTLDLVDELNDDYRFIPHITIKRVGRYSHLIHFSGRLFSKFGFLPKAEKCKSYKDSREYELERNGYDSSFDIHSCSASIIYSLNRNIPLDVNFDIKEELAKMEIKGTINNEKKILESKDYKPLLFYPIFIPDDNLAYEKYIDRFKNAYHKIEKDYKNIRTKEEIEEIFLEKKEEMIKTIPFVSKTDFYNVYNYVKYRIGETSNYINNIFLVESALMAHVIGTLTSMGVDVKSNFDGIWWKKTQVSKETVFEIFKNSSAFVFVNYHIFENSNNKHYNKQLLVEQLNDDYFEGGIYF